MVSIPARGSAPGSRRTNRQVDQAVRLIEPAILCMVAGCIGYLALGLLLPIFTMASALGSK